MALIGDFCAILYPAYFINVTGTTRDSFKGKRVVKLQYEAYVPMAEKELTKICQDMRKKWNVVKIAIIHRIG
jgi:molybdopterin synthase catalytic subunit